MSWRRGVLALALAAACGEPRPPTTPAPIAAAPAPAPVEPAPLTKDEVRPIVKALVPALAACITTDARAGVVELVLTIAGDPPGATTVGIDDVIVTGDLATDRSFRGCAIAVITAATPPVLPRAGRASIHYPVTFDPAPPDNRGADAVATAERAAAAGDWRTALMHAEVGLARTSLDGPHRRRLIEVAASAACSLADRDRARRYLALASADAEARVRARCSAAP